MIYEGISDRIKSTFFDFVIIGILMFAGTYIIDLFGEVSTRVRMFTFIVYLYEPLFVSVFGGTVGHLSNNLRVRKVEDESKKINVFQALLRYTVKIILGIISFFTMRFDDKSRAIHDMVVGSVVVLNKK